MTIAAAAAAAAAAQVTLHPGKQCSHASLSVTRANAGILDRSVDRNVL